MWKRDYVCVLVLNVKYVEVLDIPPSGFWVESKGTEQNAKVKHCGRTRGENTHLTFEIVPVAFFLRLIP